MNKKGFTLIELLAVIVILAIIALISVPTILGIIEKAKKGAAESSALGWIDAVEKQSMINTLDDNSNALTDGIYNVSDLDVKVKGEKPKSGWVNIAQGQVKYYSLVIGNYTVTPEDNNPSKAVAVKGSPKYPSIVYSNAEVVTHVGYPIDAGIDIGSKYFVDHYGINVVFNTEEECYDVADECDVSNFTTPNLDYKISPDEAWNYYLKYTLNSNGIIEEIDACGKLNGKEFCLKSDSSKYEENQDILVNTFGSEACYLDSWFTSCRLDSTAGNANIYGDTNVSSGSDYGCDVIGSGSAFCLSVPITHNPPNQGESVH